MDNPLSSVDNALNAINIETIHLENLFLEGEGAGGKPTASSVLSDLYDISQNEKFDNLFGNPPRKPEKDKITQFHMDIAASIQHVTEKKMLMLARSLLSLKHI